ncbi:MAG: radical SAM protein [Pseudomonadota bacterium]
MKIAVHLASPAMFETSVKRGVVDGELSFLATGLRHDGFRVEVYDGYQTKSDPRSSLSAAVAERDTEHVVLVHLWKVELLGEPLLNVLQAFREVDRESPGVVIGAFGYLAASLGKRLNETGHMVDFVVTGERIEWIAGAVGPTEIVRSVAEAARQRLAAVTVETGGLELSNDIDHDSVVSISGSRGCRSRCTFCAYNADLGAGWRPRPVASIAEEIAAVLSQGRTRKIAFYDNDFGGGRVEMTARTRALHVELDRRGILGTADIALNVRSDCLTGETIALLGEIGVKTMLVGLESFNEQTRLRLFGKRVDIGHLARMVESADRTGIELLLSYILWHPLQTLDGVQREVNEIVAWGRYRIPQFLSRSELLVVPGTPIEGILKRKGLLERHQPFKLRARFIDADAEEWLGRAKLWLEEEMKAIPSPGPSVTRKAMFAEIGRLKQLELDMYLERVPFSMPALDENSRPTLS